MNTVPHKFQSTLVQPTSPHLPNHRAHVSTNLKKECRLGFHTLTHNGNYSWTAVVLVLLGNVKICTQNKLSDPFSRPRFQFFPLSATLANTKKIADEHLVGVWWYEEIHPKKAVDIRKFIIRTCATTQFAHKRWTSKDKVWFHKRLQHLRVTHTHHKNVRNSKEGKKWWKKINRQTAAELCTTWHDITVQGFADIDKYYMRPWNNIAAFFSSLTIESWNYGI